MSTFPTRSRQDKDCPSRRLRSSACALPNTRHAAYLRNNAMTSSLQKTLTTQYEKRKVIPSLCTPSPRLTPVTRKSRAPVKGVEHSSRCQGFPRNIDLRRPSKMNCYKSKVILGRQPKREGSSSGNHGELRKHSHGVTGATCSLFSPSPANCVIYEHSNEDT